jgi:hypothetical protein
VKYRRTPGDTLRYRELGTSNVTLTAQDGAAPVMTRQAATIALTFHSQDSVEAWYDELMVEASDPNGFHRPDPAAVLPQSFILRFGEHGDIETMATPVFPAEFQEVTDLTQQFLDFFPHLPKQGALTVGRSWRDTTTYGDTTDLGQYFRVRRNMRFEVTGDTVLAGRTARVIALREELHIEIGGPVRGQPLDTEGVLDGWETGYFIFDQENGVLLGRRREGELTGPLVFTGDQEPFRVGRRIRYTNLIEVLR